MISYRVNHKAACRVVPNNGQYLLIDSRGVVIAKGTAEKVNKARDSVLEQALCNYKAQFLCA